MFCRFFSFALLAAIFATALAQPPVGCVSPPPSPPPCDPRRCNIDHVCYVVDQSDSITASLFAREKLFVTKFSEAARNRSASQPSSSLVAFSSEARVLLNSSTDPAQLAAALAADRLFYESTAISTGLRKCQEQLRFVDGSKSIVLVSDGNTSPAEEERTVAVAEEIKHAGINLVTTAIGCNANVDFLKQLATSADFFINLNTDDRCQNLLSVVEKICKPVDCPDVTDPCVRTSCQEAFDRCAFTFAGKSGLATFDATGHPDRSFTPMIVAKDPSVHLGVLNMNNRTPQFIDANGARDITEFGSQPFTPTHFKPFSISNTRGSGIGHQTYHGNQRQLARNRCVRVSFSEVQLLDNTRNLNDVPDDHCVVFRTN